MSSIYVLYKIVLFWIIKFNPLTKLDCQGNPGKCFLMYPLKWFAKIFSVYFWRLYRFNYHIQDCYPSWINFCKYCEVGIKIHFLFHMETQLFPYGWWFSRLVVSYSCDPIDCSPPASSVHGILQTRILEWVAISFSRGSSQPRDKTWVSCIAGRLFTDWATRNITSYRKFPFSHWIALAIVFLKINWPVHVWVSFYTYYSFPF